MNNFIKSALAALSLTALLAPTMAAAMVVIDFEGLADLTAVGSSYSGLGVEFVGLADAIVLRDSTVGGTGHFSNMPLGGVAAMRMSNPGAFTNTEGGVFANVAAGFSSFSFDYSMSNTTLVKNGVQVWSDVDGTGTLLASMDLNGHATCDVTFCTWDSVTWSGGLAKSIHFGGLPQTTYYDNITLDAPEPSTVAMLLLGLAVMSFVAHRRRAGLIRN